MPSRGARLAAAIQGHARPCALVDVEAFDRNLEQLLAAIGPDQTLRLASKSLRVPALIRRALAHDRVEGVLAYHVSEVAILADQGVDDVFLAYPPAPEDIPVLAELSSRLQRSIVTVDGAAQVEALGRAGVPLQLAIDIDVSWRKGPLHLGVRRSPIRSADDALALARVVEQHPTLTLSAVIAYEAQVAGLRDISGSLQDLGVPWLKRRSVTLAADRRRAVVDALHAAGHPVEVVNGGGTGSVHTTGRDPVVTEVAAGSGLLCPHLFDGYRDLQLEPAAFFALSVVRVSDPGYVTCYGGGYVASGEAGPDRLPVPWWPEGLKTVSVEGFGEVQTPFRVPEGVTLDWGDTVLCRHAKSGELFDHFDTCLLVTGEHVETAPTLRGAS